MTMNGFPYEEYKGWYIGRGITMPAQGIHEINIYGSIAKCAAEDPDYIVDSVEEARSLIDELGQKGGLEARVWEEVRLSWATKQVEEIYQLPLTKEEKYLKWAEIVTDKYYDGLLTEQEKTEYLRWEFAW